MQGLDPLEWMKVLEVYLLKTEASWSTQVAVTGRKHAIDQDISAVQPSEAPDTFSMHLRDPLAGPTESVRDHIHRTTPKAGSGSAWTHTGFR